MYSEEFMYYFMYYSVICVFMLDVNVNLFLKNLYRIKNIYIFTKNTIFQKK